MMIADIRLRFPADAGADRQVWTESPVVLYEHTHIELAHLLQRSARALRELRRAATLRNTEEIGTPCESMTCVCLYRSSDVGFV